MEALSGNPRSSILTNGLGKLNFACPRERRKKDRLGSKAKMPKEGVGYLTIIGAAGKTGKPFKGKSGEIPMSPGLHFVCKKSETQQKKIQERGPPRVGGHT